ncbi:hypothetical protein [Paraconexibacter sp.]|uniref:hypothetical protein n=1 Tax=Paraconexibacter sp. TaxID=2949640 RepID=UPI0035697526
MTPHSPRHRTPISRWRLALLRPILRYSYSRDAYVLRVIGNSRGPVYQVRVTTDAGAGSQPTA